MRKKMTGRTVLREAGLQIGGGGSDFERMKSVAGRASADSEILSGVLRSLEGLSPGSRKKLETAIGLIRDVAEGEMGGFAECTDRRAVEVLAASRYEGDTAQACDAVRLLRESEGDGADVRPARFQVRESDGSVRAVGHDGRVLVWDGGGWTGGRPSGIRRQLSEGSDGDSLSWEELPRDARQAFRTQVLDAVNSNWGDEGGLGPDDFEFILEPPDGGNKFPIVALMVAPYNPRPEWTWNGLDWVGDEMQESVRRGRKRTLTEGKTVAWKNMRRSAKRTFEDQVLAVTGTTPDDFEFEEVFDGIVATEKGPSNPRPEYKWDGDDWTQVYEDDVDDTYREIGFDLISDLQAKKKFHSEILGPMNVDSDDPLTKDDFEFSKGPYGLTCTLLGPENPRPEWIWDGVHWNNTETEGFNTPDFGDA